MTIEEAKSAITGKLIEAYGFSEGLRVSGVAAEPILEDFIAMLEKNAGAEVSEDYTTEDRRVTIFLSGIKEAGKQPLILTVTGRVM